MSSCSLQGTCTAALPGRACGDVAIDHLIGELSKGHLGALVEARDRGLLSLWALRSVSSKRYQWLVTTALFRQQEHNSSMNCVSAAAQSSQRLPCILL